MQNIEINSKQIDKIKKITIKEKEFRIKNLNLFNSAGFPNKSLEDWKFTDFRNIIDNNFNELNTKNIKSNLKEIKLLKDFEHNYIYLVNGALQTSNFDYEDGSKIEINIYDRNTNYKISKNPLVCLNHALAENGYFLKVASDYKFKKSLIIYNFFTKEAKGRILNNKNKIEVDSNSELHLIEYIIDESNSKFVNNIYEEIIVGKNSKLKNLYIQGSKSKGFFYKHLKSKLFFNSNYLNLIFSSGLKFNKLDMECDLVEENSNCNLLSALILKKNDHQEIKTLVNHLAPNCKSYQRIKKVLNSESKGVFQGKVYVKDIAQKTDAYQLSKALLLDDAAEFNSKPELEIYADDVKCSHGSTSGSISEDSLYYLMSRGLNRKDSINLLIKGFLIDALDIIKSSTIKKFVEKKLEEQLNGY